MRSANPLVIPRNHKVEEALEAANNDDLNPMKNLLKVLEKPYENQEGISEYQSPAPASDKNIKLFVEHNLFSIIFKTQHWKSANKFITTNYNIVARTNKKRSKKPKICS